MLGPHTVNVVRPAGRDEWGDVQSGDTSTNVAGCFWQPRSSSEDTGGQREDTGGQDTVHINAWVSMPATADILPTDRVQFEGVTYEVYGQPELHHTPAGPHHYEVQVRKVVG